MRNPLGLHARPAAQIARLAQEARGPVWVSIGADSVDATSVLDLLTLACEAGASITVSIENPADRTVMDAIVALVEGGAQE
jgi:phosphocarrier protein